MGNLSKDWQLQDAEGYLKNLTGQIAPDKLNRQMIIDSIHLGLSEVAQLLSELKRFDYATIATLTITSDAASITSLNLMSVIKIVDSTNGFCTYEPLVKFEGLRLSPQNKENVSWTRHGETIDFYKGNLAGYGTVKLHYNRYPSKATTGTDYLDIKDPYVKLALDKAKLHIHELIGSKPPATLEQSVNNTIIQMRKAHAEEMAQKKGNSPAARR